MVEYKVLRAIDSTYLEDTLNDFASAGWRVVGSFHQNGKIRPTIILEREMRGITSA